MTCFCIIDMRYSLAWLLLGTYTYCLQREQRKASSKPLQGTPTNNPPFDSWNSIGRKGACRWPIFFRPPQIPSSDLVKNPTSAGTTCLIPNTALCFCFTPSQVIPRVEQRWVPPLNLRIMSTRHSIHHSSPGTWAWLMSWHTCHQTYKLWVRCF